MDSIFKPSHFKDPRGQLFPLRDTLGNVELENIAASILTASIREDKWVGIIALGGSTIPSEEILKNFKLAEGRVFLKESTLAKIYANPKNRAEGLPTD